MNSTIFNFIAIVSYALCGASSTQQTTEAVTQVKVRDVLAVMTDGTLPERQGMMEQIVALRVMTKSAEVRRVVSQELARMNSEIAVRQNDIARGTTDPTAPDIGEYLGLLVQACAQTDDSLVLEPLLGVLDTGNLATDAVARFGSKALERVMQVAADQSKPRKAAGAVEVMSKMVAGRTVNQLEAARVVATGRRMMSATNTESVWFALMRLAFATQDGGLQSRVRAFADGTLVPSVAHGSAESAARIRRMARGIVEGKGRVRSGDPR